jgi:hypothetical protein
VLQPEHLRVAPRQSFQHFSRGQTRDERGLEAVGLRLRQRTALLAPPRAARVADRGDEPRARLGDTAPRFQKRIEDVLHEVMRVRVGHAELLRRHAVQERREQPVPLLRVSFVHS